MRDSDLERIEIELALLVRRTTAIASGRSDGPLDRSGYLLLSAMQEQGAVSVKTIAAELGLNVSTASRQLAALEKKGFAARRPDPSDGRASLFEATASGEREMAVYREKRLGRIARRIGGWSDADCGDFGRLLERFNRSFST